MEHNQNIFVNERDAILEEIETINARIYAEQIAIEQLEAEVFAASYGNV